RGDEGGVRMVDPFASLGCLFPVFRIAQVVDPPGKSSALSWPRFIGCAFFVGEKNTVIGLGTVEQGVLPVDESRIPTGKFFRRTVEVIGEALQIRAGEIDVARRAGTALAAS